MNEKDLVLDVADLSVEFATGKGMIAAVSGLSLQLARGEMLGIVGESGSGKSTTLRALMALVSPPGFVTARRMTLAGIDLQQLDRKGWSDVRGSQLAMIFQDPMTTLNPVMSVGNHLVETLRVKRGLNRSTAHATARELLERVQIPAAAKRLADYPHQLSGGMRQRVMIALAIAAEPLILLADEPTSALDVTVQDQILALLADLQRETGMSIILVSHDLDVVGAFSDRVAVMYAGRVVEEGLTEELLDQPSHPYTTALLACAPEAYAATARGKLQAIAGQPPDLRHVTSGCPFAPRCSSASEECRNASMALRPPSASHRTACIKWRDACEC